ncbi:MAG: ornithine carbamoyltransferase [Candidatus Methylacidiphilales bacterium]|nr:ornithine carbamoyltransferase [Candidatus Methylacidiphilales bacterium]
MALKSTPFHLLGLRDFPVTAAHAIFQEAKLYKQHRATPPAKPLEGQTWALIFSKSSTRTRVSFEVGIRELGGTSMFLSAQDIQLGRGEPIKDTARVLGRMIHGAVIRTFAQKDVDDFAHYSGIPTINALTDDEHPCQILTDIFTFEEKCGSIAGRKVAFIGDGACNVAVSWAYAAEQFKFHLWIAAPEGFECPVRNSHVTHVRSPEEAAYNADLLYTDVWVSMGKEAEAADRIKSFSGYQINHALLKKAAPGAIVLHCLPAYRDKEISEQLLEERIDDIMDQAENRLHVQKGILHWLAHIKYHNV